LPFYDLGLGCNHAAHHGGEAFVKIDRRVTRRAHICVLRVDFLDGHHEQGSQSAPFQLRQVFFISETYAASNGFTGWPLLRTRVPGATRRVTLTTFSTRAAQLAKEFEASLREPATV
jgi:hypothetical protein